MRGTLARVADEICCIGSPTRSCGAERQFNAKVPLPVRFPRSRPLLLFGWEAAPRSLCASPQAMLWSRPQADMASARECWRTRTRQCPHSAFCNHTSRLPRSAPPTPQIPALRVVALQPFQIHLVKGLLNGVPGHSLSPSRLFRRAIVPCRDVIRLLAGHTHPLLPLPKPYSGHLPPSEQFLYGPRTFSVLLTHPAVHMAADMPRTTVTLCLHHRPLPTRTQFPPTAGRYNLAANNRALIAVPLAMRPGCGHAHRIAYSQYNYKARDKRYTDPLVRTRHAST